MEAPYIILKKEILELLKREAKLLNCQCTEEEIENSISQSKGIGDISSSIAFRIAKQTGKRSADVAAEIASHIKTPKLVKSISSENGFINFHLNRAIFSSEAIMHILKGGYNENASTMGDRSKVVIEYISVNPVHPWHVGHLRNALIGDALSNIYQSCKYLVVRENYLDDLGLQAAEALWGLMNLQKLGISIDQQKKFDHMLGEVYVKTNKFIESDPKIMEEIRKTNKLMENEESAEGKTLEENMIFGYLKAERETASSFGIYQDIIVRESDILRFRLFDKAIEELKAKGIAKLYGEGKYAGCIAIDLKDIGTDGALAGLMENVKVLVRSDGTPNYAAKDIAYHMWKLGIIEDNMLFSPFISKQKNGKTLFISGKEGKIMKFGGADITISVIDSQQNFEQQVVKGTIEALHGEKRKEIKHLAYEVVELEGSKLSGRKGTWVGYTADDLLNEAKSRALKLISQNENLREDEKERIANAVGIAAIKFTFLKISPEKKIVFSWSTALTFDGDSGPYCQYTYARASRIIEKSGVKNFEDLPAISEIPEEAFSLIKLMALYGEIVEKACRECRPNIIGEYLIDISTSFSKFYENVQILKKEGNERQWFLSLVFAFRKILGYSLALLGIEPIDKM